MSKDSYWFRHDSTAGRGLKMRKIAHIYGHWGKGVYWDVVEMLRDTEDYEYSNEEFDLIMLADLIGCKDSDKFIHWYNDCIKFGLLEEHDGKFYSPALKSVMGVWESKKINGSKGGRPRKEITEKKPNKNLKEIEKKPKLKADENHNIIEQNIIEYNSINNKDDSQSIDFDKLLKFFNKTFNKKCTAFPDKVRAEYKKRLKKDYTKENIMNAMVNAKNDEFHIKNNYKHCTIDYFSRIKTLNLHGYETPQKTEKYNPHL